MNSRYQTDTDLDDLHDSMGQDREISLGTTTIIGIFFTLALLCAVFFGFGYSMGKRSAQTTVPSTTQTASEPPESDIDKPSPGSPARQSAALAQSSKRVDDTADSSTDQVQETPAPAPIKTVVATTNSDVRVAPPAKAPAAKPVALTPASITTATPGVGVAVVQVAAVSHQEDADILATALKKRGYTVTVRQVPQDKLLHVQIGPFATKKDADAMRQRLQADGYNAIVK